MYSLYWWNNKTIWEMQPEERRITLIVMGIMISIAIVIGVFLYLKDKKS